MKRIVTILLLAFTATAHGANLFVTATGGGAQNGADWSNAFAGIPVSSLVRGNTYYVAGGSYSGFEVATATSGATYIYFRKATATDHGTDTGWNPAFGTSQAAFGPSNPKTSYLDFEGSTGNGFKFSTTSTNENTAALNIFSGFLAPNLRLHHCEISAMTGGGVDAPVSASSGMLTASGGLDGLTIDHCYIHNCGGNWLSLGNASNVLIEHNLFEKLGSGYSAKHCAGISASGQNNITIRYNAFIDALFNVTTYIEPQVFCSGFNVYGNTFWGRSASENTSQGALAITGSDGPAMLNVPFYNNTLYGLHILTGGGVWGGNIVGANVILVTNNVLPTVTGNFPNCALGFNLPQNTVNFTNPAAGDFHLANATPSGKILASPFNVDPDGNTRGADGVWDIGAFEFVAKTFVAPEQPTNVSPSNGVIDVSQNPTLQATPFSDTNAPALTQIASQWVVLSNAVALATFSPGAVTNFTLPNSFLASGGTYGYQVRYQNTAALWSPLSPPTTFTVTNAPPPPPTNFGIVGFTSTAYSTTETAVAVGLNVQRINGTNAPITIAWQTSNGTAAAGMDYVAASGTLLWTANENSNKSFGVTIINTGTVGPPRTFFVTITATVGTPLVAPATATVSIAQRVPITVGATVQIGGAVAGGNIVIGGK